MSKPRFSGVLLHPSSLPGGDVCGTFGEPSRKWIKLLSNNGIRVWQFLPLSPTDSFGSPYSSPSSFAFNPWFIDANDLVQDGFLNSESIDDFPKDSCISQKKTINFDLANSRSEAIGKALRINWKMQSEKNHIEFARWSSKQFWLEDHALFMEIRRQNNKLPWWEWPLPFSEHNVYELKIWMKKHEEKLLEHKLLQWHLDRQWSQLRHEANEKGILLFGDLPFYVSRDSSDVWANRSLFSVSSNGSLLNQSGVPPDYFSDTGQLWGTPVYRWEKHKKTQFRWWRKRFRRQWSQVDLLRLDHFRALIAYWSVPGQDKTAEKGYWLPSPGLELLTCLKNDFGKNLPLVAEDLGVITPKVNLLREYFQFPGMKILQFAFDGNLENPYLPENINGYKWIVYTGTHDNSTTNGWWGNSNIDVRNRVLDRYCGDALEPSWRLIEIGLRTETILFISPLQDILSLDDKARLNCPGTIENNWSWRLNSFDSFLYDSMKRYGKLSLFFGRNNDNFNSSFV